jgi:hypothetical protein
MRCTTCDAVLPDGAAFCPNCGTRTPAPTSAGAPTIQIPPVETPDTPPLILPPASDTGIAPAHTPPVYYPPQTTTSTAAVLSLVFGILGVIFALPLIGPVVAVVAGHIARNEIRRSAGRLSGDGLAVAGLIMGYMMLVFSLIGICIALAFFWFAVSAAAGMGF